MEDILLDNDFDILILNGDLEVGEPTNQHQALILLYEKGHLRETPWLGVGLHSWLNDDGLIGLREEIQKMVELDGARVKRLEVYNNGKIELETEYLDQ